MKRFASIVAAVMLSVGLLATTATPAHAYKVTYMVSGKTKSQCHHKISAHVRAHHNKAPSYLKFARHSGCSYTTGFGGQWHAAVSYN